jgi:hypothetical protein
MRINLHSINLQSINLQSINLHSINLHSINLHSMILLLMNYHSLNYCIGGISETTGVSSDIYCQSNNDNHIRTSCASYVESIQVKHSEELGREVYHRIHQMTFDKITKKLTR